MNLTRDRVHSIGWMTVLLVCGAFSLALMLRVNAVKSQVAGNEKRIVYLQRDIEFLETEFQTRSNQQQLKTLNDVEFGYEAPRAEQYIEGERQLAALGKAPAPGAPKPIRYASADPLSEDGEEGGSRLLAMVSPVAGEAPAATKKDEPKSEKAEAKELARQARNLGERLARIETAGDAH
jgi:TolA-binding protein